MDVSTGRWEGFVNAPYKILPYCLLFPAIDVVIGGAPCTDFSKVNATRKGTAGEQGRYIVSFGKLVQRIQKAQPDHPLYFLSENVVLDNNDKSNQTGKGNLATVLDAFGTTNFVLLDAQSYSPVRRKRMYISNIPIDRTSAANYWVVSHDSRCLVDGYKHAALFKFPSSGYDTTLSWLPSAESTIVGCKYSRKWKVLETNLSIDPCMFRSEKP
jgi:site-specific DNA-cytosine methylase